MNYNAKLNWVYKGVAKSYKVKDGADKPADMNQ
jgi:hypothetical protein